MNIKPGDKVTCSLHPERGVGTCSYISYDNDKAFVYWGEYGDMANRQYANCKPSELIKHEPEGTLSGSAE